MANKTVQRTVTTPIPATIVYSDDVKDESFMDGQKRSSAVTHKNIRKTSSAYSFQSKSDGEEEYRSASDLLPISDSHIDGATRVGIGISFKYISDINSVDQTFTVSFLLLYQWYLTEHDNKLFEEKFNHNGCLVDDKFTHIKSNKSTSIADIGLIPELNNIDSSTSATSGYRVSGDQSEFEFKPSNKPSFHFPNLISMISMREVVVNNMLYFKPDPTKYEMLVEGRYEIMGVFSQTLDLRNFPFDSQQLSIIIASSNNSQQFCLLPEFTNDTFVKFQRKHSSIPEWDIIEPYAIFEKTLPNMSRDRRNTFWNFTLAIRVRRKLSSDSIV